MTVMLELQDVRKSFGGLRALDGLSLEVREGEIVGLIGPNGSAATSCAGTAGDYGTVLLGPAYP